MRQILIVWLLVITASVTDAQGPYSYQINNPASPNSLQTTEDATGHVGVGIGAATLSLPYTSTFTVTNLAGISSSSADGFLASVINMTGAPVSGSLPPAASLYGLSVMRAYSGSIASTLTTDLMVDQNGLVGIGSCPSLSCNNFLSAHLFITDQNGDGNPLLAVYTNASTPSLVVLGNGNVGIGTTIPGLALDVVGSGGISGDFIIGGSTIIGGSSSVNGTSYTGGTATFNGAVIVAGNVGIGTTTPAYPLDVSGNAGISGGILVGGSAIVGGSSTVNGTSYTNGTATFVGDVTVGGIMQLSNGATNGYILQSDAIGNASWVDPTSLRGLNLWTLAANNTDIYNSTLGRVCIGTNTVPSSTFGQLVVQNSGMGIDLIFNQPGGLTSGNEINFYDADLNLRQAIWDDYNSGNFVIAPGNYNYNNETMHGSGLLEIRGAVKIYDGSTPITTPSPLTAGGYSLYAQYGILTERVKVALTGGGNWSDYVFDKDYKLLELDKVKEYIAQNHHLPDVPSADDVSCDGIDLGSMDATLLKKIEELTLYVLELKKENQEIKNQITKK